MSADKQVAEAISVEDLTFQQCTNVVSDALRKVSDFDTRELSMAHLEEMAVRYNNIIRNCPAKDIPSKPPPPPSPPSVKDIKGF